MPTYNTPNPIDLASAQSQVDRARREVAGDLTDRGGQRVEQHEASRRIQSGGEPLGDDTGVVGAVLRGVQQLALQLADVLSKFHGTMVTP
jgi:hypothetical protein